MLDESGLLKSLRFHCHTLAKHQLCIWGDPAYPLRPQLMCLFREGDYTGSLTPDMIAFNAVMSRLRISVEWLSGDIANYFKFIDLKKLEDWHEWCEEALFSLCSHDKCFNSMAIPHLSFLMLALLALKPTLHSFLFSHDVLLERATKKKVSYFPRSRHFFPFLFLLWFCYNSQKLQIWIGCTQPYSSSCRKLGERQGFCLTF